MPEKVVDVEKLENTVKEYIKELVEKKAQELQEDVKEALEKALEEKIKEFNPKPLQEGYGELSPRDVKEGAVLWFRAMARRDEAEMRRIKAEMEGDAQTKAITGASNLIPSPVAATIYEFAKKYGNVDRYALRIQMTSDTLKLPTDTNDIELTETAAGTAYSAKTVSVGGVTLTAGKLTAQIDIQEETIADATVDVVDWIFRVFGRAVAKSHDNLAINGNTTAFGGMFNNANVQTYGVGTATAGSFSDLTVKDLLDISALVAEGLDENAIYGFHRTVWANLLGEQDANGAFRAMAPGDKPYRMIWGYEITKWEVLPAMSASASGVKFGFFGDLSGMALGIREPLSLRSLDQIKADQGLLTILASERSSIQLLNPSQFVVVLTN